MKKSSEIKILHVVLYNQLYTPNNGGMLRCWNISKQLSLHFKVDLFCLQSNIESILESHPNELDGHDLNFIVPDKNFDVHNNTGINKIRTAVQYRWQNRTFSSASSKTIELATMWDKLKEKNYDIIFFEHLEALGLRNRLKTLFPKAKIIFDVHNVDYLLLQNEVPLKRIKEIQKKESELYKNCDLVFACSETDANIFRKLNDNKVKVLVLPNGVDSNVNTYHLPDFTSPEMQLIFCGSLDYKPNRDGIRWFLELVWPTILKECSGLSCTIVGRGKPDDELMEIVGKSSHVNFIGETTDVKPYYRKAQIAIVPLHHGSGTRLKILEAMSLGLPVVSTTIGGEGINYTHNQNILIADSAQEFCNIIVQILQDFKLFERISQNGREFIEEHYSWDVIGHILSKNLKKQIIKS